MKLSKTVLLKQVTQFNMLLCLNKKTTYVKAIQLHGDIMDIKE